MKFYFHPSPNPLKVALCLEELGLTYDVVLVDTFRGEQHDPKFLAVNPNAKVPAIIDDGVTVFDSHAILLYLADKHGQFLPPYQKAEALSWLMFVATGLSPFSGQAVHFLRMCPEDLPYAKNRYKFEVDRHYKILENQLAKQAYLAGPDYTIADMAAWGWLNFAGYIYGKKGLSHYPNVERFFKEISSRPAAIKAQAISENLLFKSDFDEAASRALFPQNVRLQETV
ncbi:MAG: glutathione S-transferase N-terminal domain-containing protein [Cyanobacteria bacterium P01_G01_bin.38]